MPLFNLNKHKKKSGLSQDKLLLVVFRRFLTNVNKQSTDAAREDLVIIREMSKESPLWSRLYNSVISLMRTSTEKIHYSRRQSILQQDQGESAVHCRRDGKVHYYIEKNYTDVLIDKPLWNTPWDIPEPTKEKISISDLDIAIDDLTSKKTVENIQETK